MKKSLTLIIAATSVLVALGLAGCNGEAPPPEDKTTTEQSNKLHEIQQRTGGDWDKATDADKQYLLQLGHNSEFTAKMLLSAGKKKGPVTPPGTKS